MFKYISIIIQNQHRHPVRLTSLEQDFIGDKVGIDDFAYKKRHTYGTIIVDEETHNPITLLDGRDGNSFRKWLKNNKHIKVITRDRASAYAKVIAEELQDAMQIADRFHLHQNLLETIKKALNSLHLSSRWFILLPYKKAGCTYSVFDGAASEALLNTSDGTAHVFSKLCDASLLIGHSPSAGRITSEIEQVIRSPP